MIVCICRNISDSDYETEKELRDRIMQDDWNCGQCQMKYIIEDDKSVDTFVELGYN